MAKGSGSTRMLRPKEKGQSVLVAKAINFNRELASAASARLFKIIEDRTKEGRSLDGSLFKFGEITEELSAAYKKRTGVEIQNNGMYTGQSVLFHHRTGEKADKDKLVELDAIANMPLAIKDMDAYLYKKEIIFSDNVNKYVLRPNVELKGKDGKIKIINHVSSSKLKDSHVLTRANGYIKLTS